MNGKFNKEKILKQIEKNRKSARKLVENSIKDAKKILKNERLMGCDSSALAVVRLAEALFRIEASVIQGKAKVEQAEQAMKAQLEAQKSDKTPCDSCQRKSRTPVS